MRGNLRWDAKRDRNEPELVSAAERMGVKWVQAGPMDGWAGRSGRWMPIEVKIPEVRGHKDEFKASQVEFMADCAAAGLPYAVWYTVDDVVSTVNRLRHGER